MAASVPVKLKPLNDTALSVPTFSSANAPAAVPVRLTTSLVIYKPSLLVVPPALNDGVPVNVALNSAS